MTQNELYQRQQQLQLDVPRSVTIAGVGGVGSWVAIFSAMSGVPELFLFDPDVMEEHNRNRLPFCEGSINRPKVDVVREYINAIRPDAIVVGSQQKLEGELIDVQLRLSNWVIDCTDSPKSQIVLYNKCLEFSKAFIRAGYDGTHITVTSVVSGWIKDEEQETYEVNPSWVVPSAIVAGIAVAKMLKYSNQETSLDISEIGIPQIQRASRRTARCNQDGGIRLSSSTMPDFDMATPRRRR